MTRFYITLAIEMSVAGDLRLAEDIAGRLAEHIKEFGGESNVQTIDDVWVVEVEEDENE